MAPKTAVLTVDHHFWGFGAFVKSALLRTFSFHIHMLKITTSYPILLPLSLHRTTTPHSECSLIRTVRQDTPVIKPNLISHSDHNRALLNSLPCKGASFSDDTRQWNLVTPFELRPCTSPLTSSQIPEFLR